MARDCTNNFTEDAVVALRMAERGSESEKLSHWHADSQEVQPVVRVVVEMLLLPQNWSRGCLAPTDLLHLVFVERKIVRRRLNRECRRAALGEWFGSRDCLVCRPFLGTMVRYTDPQCPTHLAWEDWMGGAPAECLCGTANGTKRKEVKMRGMCG